MTEATIRQGSLVLYKNRPARVERTGDKLELELEAGKTVKVRPKDVTLLHPGPIQHLDQLQPQRGEVKTAWELLSGETTTLAELAELVYEVYTPATAWAAWKLATDGLYFSGTPEAIIARRPEEVAREQTARQAKAAEEQAWTAFLERVQAGQYLPQDERYLKEVEALSLGQRDKSRVLRELGRAESRENAHALLLELGYWDHTFDPYPQRLGITITPPQASLPELPPEERLDLTHLPAFAIDDEGNQDPDDALSLDGTRLWVHVADVAALVQPDSPADQEARARGANLYLPEGPVTMLPPPATRLLGLGLAEISPALSFGLDLGTEGEPVALEIAPSWVRVERLTYEQAEARLEEEPFRTLHHLAQRHQASRREHKAVFIDLPEVKLRVEHGSVIIRPVAPLRSRDLVLEAMLMVGQATARFALAEGIPFPFSTQDTPESRDIPDEGLAGMFAFRRKMKPSQLKSTPGPHAGLGLELYTQVTSPLRRYLDLVAHQQLRAHRRGEPVLEAQELLERVGAAEATLGSIRQAERLAREHWTLVYFLQHPGWQGEGVLVEKRGSRGLILIPELAYETHIHLRDELPLNSAIPLKLNSVNLAELSAHFQVG